MSDVRIAVGEEFFDVLRTKGCFYADKTEMIYKITCDTDARVTLFTRPRRFGKTLTMTMLRDFFDINKESSKIFEGLDVSKHSDFCSQYMNQYPVLFCTLKDVMGLEYDKAYGKLVATVANLCKAHLYLLDSKNVNSFDKEIFISLCGEKAGKNQVENAFLTLSRMMHDHFGKPVVILIDEYDVPLAKAHEADKGAVDYYPKMVDTIRGLMSGALKTNEFLKFAVITGCLRIAKESIFTGVNNFKTYGILDSGFSDSFGLTEQETEKLLNAAGFYDRINVIRQWYDGYIFGDKEMYCPWDVLNYVDDLKNNPNKEPKNYWKDTSSNDIVDEFVENEDFDVADKLENLMNGGTVYQNISDQLTYRNLTDAEDNFWSVLFMTGYLTKADKTEDGSNVYLRIPNKEIASIFKDSIVSHFRANVEPDMREEVMSAIWNEDERKLSKLLTDLLFDTISYFDYHENYYHAFMTGLLVSKKGCEVTSNQENGLGRTDIVIKDRKNRRAVIIETKKSASENVMEKDAKEGRQQIIDKQYIKGLKGYTKIVCYGISFFEKTAVAKLLDMENI